MPKVVTLFFANDFMATCFAKFIGTRYYTFTEDVSPREMDNRIVNMDAVGATTNM